MTYALPDGYKILPSHAAPAYSPVLLGAILDEKRPHDQLGGMDTLRELLQYWQTENYKGDVMELEQAVNDLRCIAKVLGV